MKSVIWWIKRLFCVDIRQLDYKPVIDWWCGEFLFCVLVHWLSQNENRRWAWIITLAREYSIILEQRAHVFVMFLKKPFSVAVLIRTWGQAASALPDLNKPNKERVDMVCKCVCWSSCDAVLSPPVPFYFFYTGTAWLDQTTEAEGGE